MKNPWVRISPTPPFVLPSEHPHIEKHNRKVDEEHRIRMELFPEPYLGNPEAPIVLLGLNPGFDEQEIPFHNEDNRFIRACVMNLIHRPQSYPFYLINPNLSDSLGHQWWMKRLKEPIALAGLEAVAQNFLCIEYFPYHTRKFKPMKKRLPSQEYNFHLVEKAMDREALIVIMRSKKLWFEAVPGLKDYPHLFILKNPQNVTISPGNLPDGYSLIENILLKNTVH